MQQGNQRLVSGSVLLIGAVLTFRRCFRLYKYNDAKQLTHWIQCRKIIKEEIPQSSLCRDLAKGDNIRSEQTAILLTLRQGSNDFPLIANAFRRLHKLDHESNNNLNHILYGCNTLKRSLPFHQRYIVKHVQKPYQLNKVLNDETGAMMLSYFANSQYAAIKEQHLQVQKQAETEYEIASKTVIQSFADKNWQFRMCLTLYHRLQPTLPLCKVQDTYLMKIWNHQSKARSARIAETFGSIASGLAAGAAVGSAIRHRENSKTMIGTDTVLYAASAYGFHSASKDFGDNADYHSNLSDYYRRLKDAHQQDKIDPIWNDNPLFCLVGKDTWSVSYAMKRLENHINKKVIETIGTNPITNEMPKWSS